MCPQYSTTYCSPVRSKYKASIPITKSQKVLICPAGRMVPITSLVSMGKNKSISAIIKAQKMSRKKSL